MRLYADRPALRMRQLGADVGLLAWLVLWVLVARAVHRAVLVLAEPGRQVEDLGRSVAGSMASAADAAGDVPLVGDRLAEPFRSLGDAGTAVGDAGQSAQGAVGTLALLLAVVLVVLPVGWLLWRWLPWRVRWAREAAAAVRLAGHSPDLEPDLELLAARAVATAPLQDLAALPPGTGARWRAGDPAAVHALAALELTRLGLALPARPARGAEVGGAPHSS